MYNNKHLFPTKFGTGYMNPIVFRIEWVYIFTPQALCVSLSFSWEAKTMAYLYFAYYDIVVGI